MVTAANSPEFRSRNVTAKLKYMMHRFVQWHSFNDMLLQLV